jgi:hypothetical protein
MPKLKDVAKEINFFPDHKNQVELNPELMRQFSLSPDDPYSRLFETRETSLQLDLLCAYQIIKLEKNSRCLEQ